MILNVRTITGPISTDDIIPGRYKHMYSDPADLAPHVFENRFPGLAATLAEGDVLWSDEIFGIGSSREQAATSLVAAGVRAVIAPRFGRIFFRNSWNVGLRLAVIASRPDAVDGQAVEIDWVAGRLTGELGSLSFSPPSERIRLIVEGGGLLQWIKTVRLSGRETGTQT